MNTACCGACLFWRIAKNATTTETAVGVCRRWPPVPLFNDGPDYLGQRMGLVMRLPQTHSDEWCGEYEASE
jgi:hypothetical protein